MDESRPFYEATHSFARAPGLSSRDLALWALSYRHDADDVDGLLAKSRRTLKEGSAAPSFTTSARLYQREAPCDGDWWWSTRPDTRGPSLGPFMGQIGSIMNSVSLEEFASLVAFLAEKK